MGGGPPRRAPGAAVFAVLAAKKTAGRWPKAAEFLDFSNAEQRNNGAKSRCFLL
jgi:hypothetical protein